MTYIGKVGELVLPRTSCCIVLRLKESLSLPSLLYSCLCRDAERRVSLASDRSCVVQALQDVQMS
jgi:hypothetical protein